MKNKFYALNALIGFLLLGLIYAWSVFVGPLEADFGWTRSETSLNFSICMSMFCLGGLAAGVLQRTKTPRQVMILSGLCILTGFVLSSRMHTLLELYLFYGALCGFGVGLGYNALLTTAMQWFPGRQGFVAGILLMGFGSGGSLLGSIALFMMNAMGWRKTFVVLGTVLAGLLFLISLNVKRPVSGQVSEEKPDGKKDFRPGEMLRDRSFYANYLRALMTSAVGFTFLGNAVPLARTIYPDATFATLIGGLVSVLNGLGRVGGGLFFDKFGSRKTLLIGSSGMCVGTLMLIWAMTNKSVPLLTAGYITGGFFYGNTVASQSTFISKVYGVRNFAVNFGIANTCMLFSSFVGPYISGILFTRTGGYVIPYMALLGMCFISLVAIGLIKRHSVPGR